MKKLIICILFGLLLYPTIGYTQEQDVGYLGKDVSFGRYLWSLDVRSELKDVVNLVHRDTLYADTLISDAIKVHLFTNAPYLVNVTDTSGLGITPDIIVIEIRKRYWDAGTWSSWAMLDTILAAEQTGSTMIMKVLWGSELHPFSIQLQYIAGDTSRIKAAKICGQ